MKTLLCILLAVLFVACDKSNPVETKTPQLTGKWTANVDTHQTNLSIIEKEHSITGTGTMDFGYGFPFTLDISGTRDRQNIDLLLNITTFEREQTFHFSGSIISDSLFIGKFQEFSPSVSFSKAD